MSPRAQAGLAAGAVPLLLILCAFLYWNGLHGPLVLDDGTQLGPLLHAQLGHGQWLDYLFSRSGPLGRPVAMATFLFNAATSGDDITRWKLTNVMIHLGCGLAVFVFAASLLATRRDLIGEPKWLGGALIAGIWLLHPLQVSTVLYTVQRMTELAGLFSFMALGAYLAGRRRQLLGQRGWPWIALGAGLFFPLAVLSKETALLLPLFALLIEWLLLDFRLPGRGPGRSRLLLGTLLAPLALGGVYFLLHFHRFVINGYAGRPFTLAERLLTECRVIMLYLSELLVPIQSHMGFVHDDLVVSRGWLQPPTTLLSALAIAALVLLAWVSRRKRPVLALGILFFFAGHLLESTVFPLELMFEHRNYVPSFGVFLALVSLVQGRTLRGPLGAALAVLILVVLSALTWLRVQTWSSEPRLYSYMLKVHPRSERIVSVVAQYLTYDGRYHAALGLLRRFDSPGALLQRLGVECLVRGRLDGAELDRAAAALKGPLNPGAVDRLIDVAKFGMDHRCHVDPEGFRQLLDRALALPIQDSSNPQMLMVYGAYYEWGERLRQQAVATLHRAYDAYPSNPMPLFLAAQWLVKMGNLADARSDYEKGRRIAARSERDYSTYMDRVAKQIAEAQRAASAAAQSRGGN